MTTNRRQKRTADDEILHRLDVDKTGGASGDPSLHRMRQLRDAVRDTVSKAADAGIDPFLADKVIRKIRHNKEARHEEEFLAGLVRLFRPIAVACAVLIVVFGIHNVMIANDYGSQTTVAETIVGLPPVTIAAAYDIPIWSGQLDQ